MTRFSSVRSQEGLVALLLAVAILTTVATTLVIRQANAVRSSGNKIALTKQRLEAIRQSIVNFAMVNVRLPCPAETDKDEGVADPVGAVLACNSPLGTVPWNDLGIASSESFDGWGRKISYRIYRANNLDPGGAVIEINSVAVDKTAFVLISHGATGYGAWLSGGVQMGVRPADPGNSQETANWKNAPPTTYFRLPYSVSTVAPSENDHFDDDVVSMTVAELRTATGR